MPESDAADELGETNERATSADDEEFLVPIAKEQAAHVDELVQDLGSPDFVARQSAGEEIKLIGSRALPKLREAYHRTDDFEVRSRIEHLAQFLYYNHHIFSRVGYLGIGQNTREFPSHFTNPHVPEGLVGIIISQVNKGTAAELAGLRKDDIIIKLDGKRLEGSGLEAVRHFGQSIFWRGPGADIKLTVLRGEQQLNLTATLGTPPPQLIMYGNIQAADSLREELDKRYPAWWERNFKHDK